LDAGARDAVHALKYGGLSRIATDLAAVMVGLQVPALDAALLVPVPLARARVRERGYNQSERLARALGRRWRRPVVDLLVRTRDTVPQTALTPEARLANVAGAFATRNAEGGTRNGRTGECSAFRLPTSAFQRPLVLVDDVFTTGATLAEAARALDRAGARAASASVAPVVKTSSTRTSGRWNAEVGSRNAEHSPVLPFRVPPSAFRVANAPATFASRASGVNAVCGTVSRVRTSRST